MFLYRYAKLAGVGGASSYQPSASDYRRFSDVKKGSFASTEILWLASAGITKGNADGTFRGGDKLSRQDMAVFLHRLDGKSSGADTPVSSLSISGSGVSNGKLSLARGGTVQLSAVNVPSGASTVTWWSDDDAVAVTGTGLVIGVKAGSGVVHVQAGGQSAVLTVTVK